MKLTLFLVIAVAGIFVLNACRQPKPAEGQQYRSLNISSVKEILDADKDVVLLDVRTPGEVADGKIDGALTINVMGDSFDEEIAKLDKDKTYVVYCRSGGRSVTASKKMLKAGFNDVINMEGGYSSWK